MCSFGDDDCRRMAMFAWHGMSMSSWGGIPSWNGAGAEQGVGAGSTG